MAQDIAHILGKKRWTGDEVGKALIASAIHSYQQVLKGAEQRTELFSAAQLKRMISSLNDREQLRRYNRYVGLNNWLTQYQAVANAYLQMIDGKVNMIFSTITTAQAVEESYLHLALLPVIMTRSQYDAFSETAALDPQVYSHNSRAKDNGIAILLPRTSRDSRQYLDEQGDYHEFDALAHVSASCGLEQYTPRNPDHVELIANLQKMRKDIIIALCNVIGYDTAVELIAEYIEMPDFLVFRMNSKGMLHRVDQLNKLIEILRQRISFPPYQNPDVQEAKLNVMRDYFTPLPIDLSVPESAITQAKALLQDNMTAFEKQDGRFMGLLTEWR